MRGQSPLAGARDQVEQAQLQIGLLLDEVGRMLEETAPTGATPSAVAHTNADWLAPRLATCRTLQAQALGRLNALVAQEYQKKELRCE